MQHQSGSEPNSDSSFDVPSFDRIYGGDEYQARTTQNTSIAYNGTTVLGGTTALDGTSTFLCNVNSVTYQNARSPTLLQSVSARTTSQPSTSHLPECNAAHLDGFQWVCHPPTTHPPQSTIKSQITHLDGVCQRAHHRVAASAEGDGVHAYDNSAPILSMVLLKSIVLKSVAPLKTMVPLKSIVLKSVVPLKLMVLLKSKVLQELRCTCFLSVQRKSNFALFPSVSYNIDLSV